MKRFKLYILSAIINRVYYRKHSVWNLLHGTKWFRKVTEQFEILNDELYYAPEPFDYTDDACLPDFCI